MAHCQRALAETVSDPKLAPLDLERRRLVAGKLLGSTFAGDERARELLEDEASRQNPGALIGLCLGWPNSITLDRAYEEMVRTGVSFPVALHLGSVCADADAFERIVTTAIDRANGDVWQFIPEWVDPIASKLASDEASFDRFLERLEVTTHPNERASLSRLLAIASGRNERLREWCQHQLAALMAGQSLADFGFDVVANRERPVAHALLDILMPY